MAIALVYGPVPSRRLGRSLGVNNIPPKICSYSCVYCQLGRTLKLEAEPRSLYEPTRITEQIAAKLKQLQEDGQQADYLTFVADGEPTLDINLGQEIEAAKKLGVKVAVITNGSLLCHESVRQNLQMADWVSLKVDTVSEGVWLRVNRPHHSLKLEAILQGMADFIRGFNGELVTETMLTRSVNDSISELSKVAEFLVTLKPATAYLAVPTRPTAERAEIVSESAINTAYQVLTGKITKVENLIGYEGNAFACTGNVPEDILSITSVHPMKEEAVTELLKSAGAGWETIKYLIDSRKLVRLEYQGEKFYMRRLPAHEIPRSQA